MENPDQPNLFDWGKIKAGVTDPQKIRQLILTILPYVVIYVVFLVLANQLNITREAVQNYFAGFGGLLVPVFIGVQLLASLTPLPDLPFLAAGILFFRPWASFALILVGMWLGTMINFLIARRLGRKFIQGHYPETSGWVDRFAGRYGVVTVIVARNFTFVTFDLVAYAAGISSIPMVRFSLASAVGLIPIALNATLMGLAVTATLEENGLTYANVARGILIFAFTSSLSLAFAFLAHRLNKVIENRNVGKP